MAGPRYLSDGDIEVALNMGSENDEDFLSGSGSDNDYEPSVGEQQTDEEFSDYESTSETENISLRQNIDSMFVSKDNIVWSPTPLQEITGRNAASNVLRLRPGTTSAALSRVTTVMDAFLLFFPPNIEKIILDNTNAFGRLKNSNHEEVDANLLHAYFGVLLLAGVYKSKNQAICELFDSTFGPPIFREIMSKQTFEYLTKIIRFDDTVSRRQCNSQDKFAPIRHLWDRWSEVLPLFFNPSECVTVDEQLCGFHGRCSFRQYMPSKPERYGLKFWLLVCSETCYVWKIQPYLGKAAGAVPEKNQGQRVVLDLVQGLRGHNVTMDNFFSSYELGQRLLEKKLTMVGTMRKNKRSIPPKLLLCKKAPLYQTTFAFTHDTTLVSYVGRKDKCTVLQSTFHSSVQIGTDPKKLPEIVSYYNRTKGGVDTVDKMITGYSCKRKTNRWPMVVFSNMIDISALNAFIIYKQVYPNWPERQKNAKRRVFLRDLGLALAQTYISERKRRPRIKSSLPPSSSFLSGLTVNVENITSEDGPARKRPKIPEQVKKRGRCFYCVQEKNSRSKYNHELACCFCQKTICKAHHCRNICISCIDK